MNPINELKRGALEFVFAQVIGERKYELPKWGNVSPLDVLSWDGRHIRGWYTAPEPESRGSMMFLHGFTRHAGDSIALAKRMAEKHGLVVAACDFRGHGRSDTDIPTFGKAESWDLQAVVNAADAAGFPTPYLLFGASLGAMAAQVCTIHDTRIAGMFAVSPPAWPWAAVFKDCEKKVESMPIPPPVLQLLGGGVWAFISLINDVYRDRTPNVLDEGALMQYEANPPHEPLVCYLMGDEDHYDVSQTRKVWDHWYAGRSASYGVGPSEAPDQLKWMIELPGFGHPGMHERSPEKWEGFESLLDEFVDKVLARHSAHSAHGQDGHV